MNLTSKVCRPPKAGKIVLCHCEVPFKTCERTPRSAQRFTSGGGLISGGGPEAGCNLHELSSSVGLAIG